MYTMFTMKSWTYVYCPKRKPCAYSAVTPHCPHLLSLTPTSLLSVWVDSPVLDISYKQNHTIRDLSCLASFTEHNVLKVLETYFCLWLRVGTPLRDKEPLLGTRGVVLSCFWQQFLVLGRLEPLISPSAAWYLENFHCCLGRSFWLYLELPGPSFSSRSPLPPSPLGATILPSPGSEIWQLVGTSLDT